MNAKGVILAAVLSLSGCATVFEGTTQEIKIVTNPPGASGVTAAIAANIAADVLLTGGLSSIVDSATGADNKYDSAVNLTMNPTPHR